MDGNVFETNKFFSKQQSTVDAALDAHGNTPLIVAAREGQAKLVRFLLRKGADPSHRNNRGLTPLLTAVSSNHIEVVRLLLNHGANPNNQPPENEGFLHLDDPLTMALELEFYDVADLLLKYNADVSLQDRNGMTPLIKVSCNNKPSAIEYLLTRGATLGRKDDHGWTALHCAAWNGALESLRVLLASGANPNQLTFEGYSSLALIARSSLWKHEQPGWAKPLKNRRNLETPENIKKLTWNLLVSGAEPNLSTEQGNYPLHFLVRSERRRTTRLLLRYGANPFLENNFNTSPVDIALEKEELSLFESILRHQMVRGIRPVSTRMHRGLLEAAGRGNVDHAEKFLSLGAHPNFESLMGWTPLLRAADADHERMIRLLIEHGGTPCRSNKWTIQPVDLASPRWRRQWKSHCELKDHLPLELHLVGPRRILVQKQTNGKILDFFKNWLGQK